MVRWEEIRKYHDPIKIREALRVIFMLREKERLRGSKKRVEDVLRLGEAARRLIELYEEVGKMTFVTDENGRIKKIVIKLTT